MQFSSGKTVDKKTKKERKKEHSSSSYPYTAESRELKNNLAEWGSTSPFQSCPATPRDITFDRELDSDHLFQLSAWHIKAPTDSSRVSAKTKPKKKQVKQKQWVRLNNNCRDERATKEGIKRSSSGGGRGIILAGCRLPAARRCQITVTHKRP